MRPRFHRISRTLLIVTALAALAATVSAHTEISASEAQQMIASGQDLIVLDVREYSEFCDVNEHIEDAVNLPWGSGVLESRFAEVPSDATIVVVCAGGTRSHLAATFLDAEGYSQVYDIEGGMAAWEWETEACELDSFLVLRKNASDVEINWTPVTGIQDYDLLRGLLSNISAGVFSVDLGPADCLAELSPYSYHAETETPLAEVVYFYLSRQSGASWGSSSQGQERVPQSCD